MCLTCIQLISPSFCGCKPPHFLMSSAWIVMFRFPTTPEPLVTTRYMNWTDCSTSRFCLLAARLCLLGSSPVSRFLHNLNQTLNVPKRFMTKTLSRLWVVVCRMIEMQPVSDTCLAELSCIWNPCNKYSFNFTESESWFGVCLPEHLPDICSNRELWVIQRILIFKRIHNRSIVRYHDCEYYCIDCQTAGWNWVGLVFLQPLDSVPPLL